MKKPFILGLTGSIGMGKSTVTRFFREAGVPVWDADEVVHQLYSNGREGVRRIAEIRPEAIKDDAVDRTALKAWVMEDPLALKRIEAKIHPLLARSRFDFLSRAESDGSEVVVLDIPLLYETKLDRLVDAVLVVSAPPEIQRERVLARPDMTPELFEKLLSEQMPDAEKRRRAEYVIESVELEPTRAAVMALLDRLKAGADHA